MRELTVPPDVAPPQPTGKRLQEDHTDAYGRLTDTQRRVAHVDTELTVKQTSPSPSFAAATVWEGPPTQAQYLELVRDEIDSYDPAFRAWLQARLPAPAG